MIAEHTLPSMFYDNLNKYWFTATLSDGTTQNFSKLYYAEIFTGTEITGGTYVLDTGVLGGIVAGCFTAYLYNRFKEIKLPQALAFFGGRRFVLMLAILMAIPIAFVYAVLWPWVQLGLTTFGNKIQGGGVGGITGAASYGFVNRLLLPFGLHQILNTFLWFQLPITGDQIDPLTGAITNSNVTINGDINAFTKGIFGSGNFQSVFSQLWWLDYLLQ